jgi:hypothetical protein
MKTNFFQSRATTVAGGTLGFGGIVLSLIPSEVRDPCVTAVATSGSPLTTSILIIAGLLLTVVGPSVAKNKNAQDQSE